MGFNKFTRLRDTPNSYVDQKGKVPEVKDTEDGLSFVDRIKTFLGLTDTPSSYEDQAGKVATVKAGEDGLEFKEAPGLIPYAPAGCPIAYNDPLVENTTVSLLKVKEIRIPIGGGIRVGFDLRNESYNITVSGQIYRNGSPVGTYRTVSLKTWTTFTEDIYGWSAGDLLQLYIVRGGDGDAQAKNLRLYADHGPLPINIMGDTCSPLTFLAGLFSNYQDLLASRSLDTIYQNTTGGWLIVITNVDTISGDYPLGSFAVAEGMIGEDSPPISRVCFVGNRMYMSSSQSQGYHQLIFFVPADYYYSVKGTTSGRGAVALMEWWEIQFG